MALKIYLADLTHTGNGIATEGMPLNIGLMTSVARKRFGKAVDIRLFKYPEKLKAAIDEDAPDVLGCSNYVWNTHLGSYFSKMVKARNPEAMVVWGGTNFPFPPAMQEAYLRDRPEVDIHIHYEGEEAFCHILENRLGATRTEVLDKPIKGCRSIHPATGQFLSGGVLPRMRSLDDYESPYVTGILDEFFDGMLSPICETARGCPFHCNFCNAGDEYFNKVNKFSDDYVREEFTYIAKKAKETGVKHLTLTDNNFGMIPRDRGTAELLHQLQVDYGWPLSVTMFTGKNSKQRVMEVTRILGDSISLSMSLQSLDPAVLKNIKRDNIRLEDFHAVAEELVRQGRPPYSEVIMPLPGESLKSHINGLNILLDTRVDRFWSHTLQILYGTVYKDDPEYLTKHGYQTKFRIVPLDFSKIGDTYLFDNEEVGIATKDMSFEEYIEARKYLFMADLCHSSGAFAPIEKLLRAEGRRISEWVNFIYSSLDTFSPQVREVIDSFVQETKGELWDSEAELIAHYSKPENYQRLLNAEAGGNVLFKHRVWMLTLRATDWVGAISEATRRFFAADAENNSQAITDAVETLRRYILSTLTDISSAEEINRQVSDRFDYDVPAWLKAEEGVPLTSFRLNHPLDIDFTFRDRDRKVFIDAMKRYGDDVPGLVKLIQRSGNIPRRQAFV